MKKLTKSQEKLLEQVKEFLATLNDTDKDEWYATDRDFAKYPLCDFLNHIGISITTEDLSEEKS